MNIKYPSRLTFLLIFCGILVAFPVTNISAQSSLGGETQKPPLGGETQVVPFSIDNPLKYNTLSEFIEAIMGLVLQIMTPVIAILIIWTGFLFVKARGNPAEIAKAKQAFLWVVIGAAIMLGAFVLKSAIEGTVGQLGDGSVIFTILQPYV